MAKEFKITKSDNWFVDEDKEIRIDVLQSDESTPQNMTGWSLTYEILTTKFGKVEISKTVSGGGVSIGDGDGTNDRATITINDTDTENLYEGTHYHRLRRTDAGFEQTLSEGEIYLRK